MKYLKFLRKCVYKTLSTSVIYSAMSPPSLCNTGQSPNNFNKIMICFEIS